MSAEFVMYTLSFRGQTEVVSVGGNNDSPAISKSMVQVLNENSQEIAKDIENEVSRVFRVSISSQVELRFYEGSIIVEGTILLISWVGPIVLASTRKAIENQLTKLVEVAIRRVLHRHIRAAAANLMPNAVVEPMRQMTVTLDNAPELVETEESSRNIPGTSPQNSNLLLYAVLIVNSITMVVLILFVIANI